MRALLRVASAGLAACATLALACSHAGRSAAELAADRAEALAENHANDETFTLRLNPAPCDCPEFEVLLDDGWHRVFLEPKDLEGPAEGVRAFLTGVPDRPPPSTARVLGRLSKSIKVAPNRAPCLVLKVIQPCGPNGCRPAE